MSESLFEAATAVLTGFDVNQARQWREEDRQWRRADLDFRQLERHRRDQELQFMQHAHQWRAQDVEQMTLDNARAIWDRCVETNRRDIEERAEQLKSISNLAALVAGFAMISFLQFQFQVTDASQAITMGFGISTALVVALNVNAMMMCALIHASILKSGPEYVSDAEEADFMSRCRQFAIRYQRGDRPPAPRRHFRAHWNNRCEGEWRRAFYMFSAGIPIFLANMAFAGWIKFSPRLGFQAGTPIIITALMGLGTVYFLLSHGRWASHILTQAPQSSEQQLDPAGLPWDWHLPPKLHLALPKADLAQSSTAANSDIELAACMPDSALSETDQAGALLEADPQRQPSAQPHQVSKRAVTPSPSDLESMGSGQMANAC